MRSIFVSVICKAILLLTQHKRLCLSTKATNELSFKKKNPSCELSASHTSSAVNAFLHCDCRGKKGAGFEDNDAEEATPKLKARKVSRPLPHPSPRSNHRIF